MKELPVIPALAQVAIEPAHARRGVEDYAQSLADAKHLEAVERVEARIVRDFNATAINSTLFVQLAIATADRRTALGAAPALNPAAAALTAILARAAGRRNSLQDVGRIHALIHHHAAAEVLPHAEAAELLQQCKDVYLSAATGTDDRQAA